jgi:hypothetical protein
MANETVELGIVLAPELRGFYIERDSAGQWLFGRPKNGAIYWDKVELSDLLNFGICLQDLESVLVNHVYRASAVAILLHPS